MAYKQYPTVQQMVGIFQGLAQQQLEREKLEADKRHQKQYGKYLAGRLKAEEQQAELLRAKNQMMFMKDWFDMRNKMGEAMQVAAENRRALYLDIANSKKGMYEAQLKTLGPGDSETPEMVELKKQIDTLYKKAEGWKDIDIAESQRNITAITMPDEKITAGQEFQVLANMPKEGMPDDALKNLAEQMNKLSGKKIFTAEMLKSKDDTAGQRGMRATIVDLIGEQRLSPDDAESLIRLIDIKDFKGLAVELAETIKPKPLRLMPAAVFNAELEAIKYLPEEQQEKAKVELVARQRTAYSHEIGERKEFHAVTIFKDPDAWLLKGKTIEPLDFETAHTLYKEGKVSQADMSQFSQFVLGVDQTSPDNTEPKPSNKSGKKWTAPGGFKPEE